MNLNERKELAMLIERFLEERGDTVGTFTAAMVRAHHGLPNGASRQIARIIKDETRRTARRQIRAFELHEAVPRYAVGPNGGRYHVYTYRRTSSIKA